MASLSVPARAPGTRQRWAPPVVTDDEWDQVALDSGNLFASRLWLDCWARHEHTGDVLRLVSRHPDGTLAGMLCLAVVRRFPILLRPLGPWPAPAATVLCADADKEWVTRDLLGQLESTKGWDVALLDADAPLPTLRGAVIETSPTSSYRYIELTGRTWEDVLAGSSKNSRHAYKRRLRRLTEHHEVRFRRTETEATLARDLDQFLRLHWSRWGERTNLLTAERRPFLEEFTSEALSRGWLSLWFLDVDGTAAAAQLSFRFAGNEFAFMSALEPAFRDEHVGISLLFHTVRAAAADGVERFHLLRGDEDYKDRLPNVDRPMRHLGLAGSAAGHLTMTGWQAAQRVGALRRSSPGESSEDDT